MSDQPSIRRLPDVLANQIAAGEVVQRPESVVKELVENAIDAGARAVTVVVREAGKQLIHIVDDGSGMSKEDLELSIVRHATSKITSIDDLHALRTLGFRGEALASIAAVADVEIRTRRQRDDTGWTLTSRPGGRPSVQPASLDRGTQILVRNLFYNVPARRKFLKSDLTEFRYISETVQRLALSRTDVRFTFYDGAVLVFDVHPGSLRERISTVLAVDAASQMVAVDGGEQGVRVHGYVGRPGIARQSRSGQFLTLNGRPIVSRSLTHAVASAFERLLLPGQQPVFVLSLEIDPERVDVNVHPQKHEVKFDDERLLYLTVQQAVAAALSQARLVPDAIVDIGLSQSPLQSLGGEGAGPGLVMNRLTGEIMPSSASTDGTHDWGTWAGGGGSGGSTGAGGYDRYPAYQRQQGPSAAQRAGYDALFHTSALTGPAATLRANTFQADGRWIVTSTAEGLFVIDQSAAHERVLYERLLRKEAPVSAGQALLFSVQMALSADHRAVLREYLPSFERMGFRLELTEDGKVHIHAVPGDVHPGDEERMLKDTLDEVMAADGATDTSSHHERLAAALARRQAVRRGAILSTEEQQALVRDLLACTVPHVSAHGVPTYSVIPFSDILQRFAAHP